MKREKDKIKGSYTIEAALLMSIILPLLVGIVYMGFYIHDRGFLQGAAHETAVYGSLHRDDKGADMNQAASKLISGRLLGTAAVSSSAAMDEKKASVSYEGSFRVPGMIQGFFGQEGISLGSQVELTVERPSRRIQKIRGVMKIADRLRGRSE